MPRSKPTAPTPKQHFDEKEGVVFTLWAPAAKKVFVAGDFNDWKADVTALRCGPDGIWAAPVRAARPGHRYKFVVHGADDQIRWKADPRANFSEMRPGTASVVAAPLQHPWADQDYRQHWQSIKTQREAISIYEVHPGSWRRGEHGAFLTWGELAVTLIPYVTQMGFTHIEFLPIAEHPLDESWGYQSTGFFAPSSRFGPPEGFARFVDAAHRAGLGVILDLSLAHFPLDEHGLAQFDGTALYEYADPRLGWHRDWQSAVFDFAHAQVRAFLVDSARHWVEAFHVDALRIDAVASMLYRDYSRPPGQWLPNDQGGKENWDAAALLRELNDAVHEHHGTITIAEESTAWPGVCQSSESGGLGFDFKWNMGFMQDTLRYLRRSPSERTAHSGEVLFSLHYAFSEHFILPLSHDEVVHGKGSLLQKMPGNTEEKFAQLRAYYAFMWGYPGKKLLFMGQEFAQWREWSESRGLDWELLQNAHHAGMQRLITTLNRLYRQHAALHRRDCEHSGFEWLPSHAEARCVFTWLRKAPHARSVAVIAHFGAHALTHFSVPLPKAGGWRVLCHSAATRYGGHAHSTAGAAGLRVRLEEGALVMARREHDGVIRARFSLSAFTTLWLQAPDARAAS